MLPPITDPGEYVATRTAWHTLAERVLAPARHAATGRIGLRPAPGGITTAAFGDGLTIAVDGDELVRTHGPAVTREPITTLRAAAALAGTDPAVAIGVFEPTTPSDPDAALEVDPGAAAVLAAWFAFGERVLTAWSRARSAERPSEIQLWPEHFDLALDLGPTPGRANYGASPGDAGHPLPYLYVGPWEPNDDAFWNAGGYARLPYDEVRSADDPAAATHTFFAAGRAATRDS